VVAVALSRRLAAVISYRYAFEVVNGTARLTRELRLGHWRAAGGASDARAAMALASSGDPGMGRGGLPMVLR
jgi:hypothetical protein